MKRLNHSQVNSDSEIQGFNPQVERLPTAAGGIKSESMTRQTDAISWPFSTLGRWLLRAWARTGVRPGQVYQLIEKYGRRLASRPLNVRLVDGVRVRCRLDEAIQRQIYFFGAYEPIESYLFRTLLRSGMTVIDLGANIGQYTLLAAQRVGPSGHVHAFEPIPGNFERLKAHVEANGFQDRVALNRAAAWSHDTTLTFSLTQDSAFDNETNYTAGKVTDPFLTLQAEGIKLDDYAKRVDMKPVGLVKLDIEGAELYALQGMAGILERDHPILLMEINRIGAEGAGNSPEEVEALLKDLGYRFWSIGEFPSSCRPMETFRGVDRVNVLAHTSDLPADVTSGWSLKRILRGQTPPMR